MRYRETMDARPDPGAGRRPGRHGRLPRWLLASLLAAAALPAGAQELTGDANRGRLLYENHCQGCHTSRAHVRDNRKANTIAEVRGWVNRWQATQALGWSATELDDVTAWLYLRFYDPARPRQNSPGSG